jgi:hypothetical protein
VVKEKDIIVQHIWFIELQEVFLMSKIFYINSSKKGYVIRARKQIINENGNIETNIVTFYDIQLFKRPMKSAYCLNDYIKVD